MKAIFCCWLLAGLAVVVHGQTIQLVTHRHLDVTCFYNASIDQVGELHNLSILFSKKEETTHFKPLATIDVKEGVKNVTDAEITGVINPLHESWLNITWPYPFREREGIYKCVAKGFNAAGSAASSESIVTIHVAEIKEVLHKLKDQGTEINRLLEKQLTYRTRLQRSRRLLFHQSEAHNGSRYYLSVKRNSTTEKEAQAGCELFGGYLAEYETEEEYQFIKSFLSKFPSYKSVLMSGTDELTENTWISQHTKGPVKMIKWDPKEPNGGRNENCLGFRKNVSWFVGDIPCDLNTDEFVHGYLCEVTETEA